MWVVLVTRVAGVVSLGDDRVVVVVDAVVVRLIQSGFLLGRQVVDHALGLRLGQKSLFLRLRGATRVIGAKKLKPVRLYSQRIYREFLPLMWLMFDLVLNLSQSGHRTTDKVALVQLGRAAVLLVAVADRHARNHVFPCGLGGHDRTLVTHGIRAAHGRRRSLSLGWSLGAATALGQVSQFHRTGAWAECGTVKGALWVSHCHCDNRTNRYWTAT